MRKCSLTNLKYRSSHSVGFINIVLYSLDCIAAAATAAAVEYMVVASRRTGQTTEH